MRKILSVLLAVVMLAAMFVMPTSAAAELGLVITEIAYDSGFDPFDGVVFRDRDDMYEFVEVYNASEEEINLYDYSLAFTNKAGTNKFTKFTPILDPAVSETLGNKKGSVNTSSDNVSARSNYFPSNPTLAILEPGETAIIWLYSSEAYAYAYGNARDSEGIHYQDGNDKYQGGVSKYALHDGGVPVEAFKEYYGITDDVLIVAVDANAVDEIGIYLTTAFGTIGREKGGDEWWANVNNNGATRCSDANGAATKANDMMKALYPSADGRFQLPNEGTATVALVKSEKFEADKALANLTFADAECYVTYTAEKNSVADKSVAYTYNVEAAASVGQEYALAYSNPGALFAAQVNAFTTFGCINKSAITVDPWSAFDYLIGDTVSDENYIIEVDVESLVQLTAADTWKYSDVAGITWDAANGTLTIKNDRQYPTWNGKKTQAWWGFNIVELVSSEALEAEYNEYVYSDFVISYDIKYLGDVGTGVAASHAGLIYAYDGNVSYSAFLLTEGGYGINRICYMGMCDKYDAGSAYYAGTLDSGNGVSIINRITKGNILAADPTVRSSAEALRMSNYGEAVNVTVLFDWDRGTTVYVNGAKVSEPTSAHENELKFARGDFGLGVIASPTVWAEISNIEMAYVSEPVLTEYELYFSNATDAEYRGSEPATGDATVYVVVAMAIAFVSLAAVVIIKRNKATN